MHFREKGAIQITKKRASPEKTIRKESGRFIPLLMKTWQVKMNAWQKETKQLKTLLSYISSESSRANLKSLASELNRFIRNDLAKTRYETERFQRTRLKYQSEGLSEFTDRNTLQLLAKQFYHMEVKFSQIRTGIMELAIQSWPTRVE